ncbi:MAG: phosphoenolpyruvate synthase [Burkholderiales bacterium]|jgi:pyruvate,water dikinase|nr:phosphoenolpyruvate synthase [Burkholderiales bacterium]
MQEQNIIWFENLGMKDIDSVGGKNASLGEMISELTHSDISVPGGFATTSHAYKKFLAANNLKQKIDDAINKLNIEDVIQLAKTARSIQQWIIDTPFPKDLEQEIETAYAEMLKRYGDEISVAVRSSATAEDLPDASFAGQQDTFLNIRGIENVKTAVKQVFASLYNDRAITYRQHKGFDHSHIYLSAGIQKMVRSDVGSSGVMFTIDTESGFDKVVFITSSYGLGECVVQGMVNPDEFYVYKEALAKGKSPIIRKTMGSKNIKMVFTDLNSAGKSVNTINVPQNLRNEFSIKESNVVQLAKFAVTIEKHYGKPMDIEWGLDGIDGKIYILQARPETVKSQEKQGSKQIRYQMKEEGHALVKGRAVGQKAANGVVRIVHDHREMNTVEPGDILVTDMTDPDWEPVMKRASAIVTNRGGRTCHAAIIARELGIPAIVGCENATEVLKTGQLVTVSCCEGDTGIVYDGKLKIQVLELDAGKMPELPVKIMMNVGNPELAFNFASIPNFGVGLARLEFIINRQIGVHPKALLEFDTLPEQLKETISHKIAGYSNPVSFYVDKLSEGIATIAAAFYPKKVIVRLSDFKSNEYSNLIGGKLYEPIEENPMMGFRGASRYIAPSFRDCFELECMAINKVRNQMGLDNVIIMIPFVRTTKEAASTIEILAENGLERGVNNLSIYMMCEIPSNAILAEEFLHYFDGFSIGSNDMTQLTLGIDRDSNGAIAASFDERNEAVKAMLHLSIAACRKLNKYIGICGQGPSDHPDFAKWLIDEGIETISLNPDTVIDTWLYLAEHLSTK